MNDDISIMMKIYNTFDIDWMGDAIGSLSDLTRHHIVKKEKVGYWARTELKTSQKRCKKLRAVQIKNFTDGKKSNYKCKELRKNSRYN